MNNLAKPFTKGRDPATNTGPSENLPPQKNLSPLRNMEPQGQLYVDFV